MKVVTATESRAGAPQSVSAPAEGRDGPPLLPLAGRQVGRGCGNGRPGRLAPLQGGPPWTAAPRAGRVGPPGAPCWFAAWSPNGKWMYLNSPRGRDLSNPAAAFFRAWGAQPHPNQSPPGQWNTKASRWRPHGRSLVTAAGAQAELGLAGGVAKESDRVHRKATPNTPRSSLMGMRGRFRSKATPSTRSSLPDGKRLLYLTGKSASGPKELWMAELDTGRNEPVLPGFLMNEDQIPRVPYDISPDGQRVVVEVADAEGRNRLWLAPLTEIAAPANPERGRRRPAVPFQR